MPLDTKPYTIDLTYTIKRTFNIEAIDQAHAERLVERHLRWLRDMSDGGEIEEVSDIAQHDFGETYLTYKQRRLQEEFSRRGQLSEKQCKLTTDLYVGIPGEVLVKTTVSVPKHNVGWNEARNLNAFTSPVDVSSLLVEGNTEGNSLVYFLRNKRGTYTLIEPRVQRTHWHSIDRMSYGVLTYLSSHCVKRAYTCRKQKDWSFHSYYLEELTKEDIEVLNYRFTAPTSREIQAHRDQLEEALFT